MNLNQKIKLTMSVFLATLVGSVTFAAEQTYRFHVSECFRKSAGPHTNYVCNNGGKQMVFPILNCVEQGQGTQKFLICTLDDESDPSQTLERQTVGKGLYVQTYSKTLNIVANRYAEVNALYQALITVTQTCQGENYDLRDVKYSNDSTSSFPQLEAIATVRFICK